jgi:hypothetical protein
MVSLMVNVSPHTMPTSVAPRDVEAQASSPGQCISVCFTPETRRHLMLYKSQFGIRDQGSHGALIRIVKVPRIWVRFD